MEVGCWAHCRRRFFEALSTDKERAKAALGFIARLYQVDRETLDMPVDERKSQRAARAGPVLQSFMNWVDHQALEVLPESPIGKAVAYARNQRIALARFLEDGRLRLDNNKSERELRREAVGRKNWLFVGSDDGAKWNATFVSLIASCQQHKLEPWAYLRDLLCLLSDWPASRLLELRAQALARDKPEARHSAATRRQQAPRSLGQCSAHRRSYARLGAATSTRLTERVRPTARCSRCYRAREHNPFHPHRRSCPVGRRPRAAVSAIAARLVGTRGSAGSSLATRAGAARATPMRAVPSERPQCRSTDWVRGSSPMPESLVRKGVSGALALCWRMPPSVWRSVHAGR